MATVEEALAIAGLGWRIVPVQPRRKVPAARKWQEVASTDPAFVRDRWGGRDLGICVATGQSSGIWVLDVDIYDGGLITLNELVANHGPLPKGPRANTGTGGFHLYFANPPGLHVTTDRGRLGKGLDVRGDGGQVLAPPTGHAWDQCKICGNPAKYGLERCPGLDYRWHRTPFGAQIPVAPDWLLELVTPPAPVEPPAWEPAPKLLTSLPQSKVESAAQAITEANDWHTLLSRDGWTLAERMSSGDTMWTRPGKAADKGASAVLHEPEGPLVNYSTSIPELCQGWARSSKGDGWSYSIFGYLAATRHNGDRSAAAREWRSQYQADLEDEWRRTVGGVQGARTYPGGSSDSREANGEANDDLSWAHLIRWDEFWAKDHAIEQWAVWPLIPAGRGVALFAPAKAGKSTIVLAAVAAAACGRPIFGARHTDPIDVLYVDYEMTEADIWERLSELGFGPDADLSHLHYAMLPSLFPLDTPNGAAQIVRLAQSVNAQVVVIDTYSRAVEGDENDADTSRAFYRHTGMALKNAGIAVLRTDHAGKDLTLGQRGSSSKNDDVDVVWLLKRTDQGVTVERTHSRVSWVPPSIEIDHIEHDDGSVVYRLADRRQWPEGTKELAELMGKLQIPMTASGREAGRILREAGQSARNDRIRAAMQFRATYALGEWADQAPNVVSLDERRQDRLTN